MADRHPVDPLAEIDTLLRAELAVHPSHEFLPRVRARLRAEPPPARWSLIWLAVPLAAAATLLLAINTSLWTIDSPPPAHASPAPDIQLAAPSINDRRATLNAQRATANDHRTTSNDQRPTINDQRTSEVIVDQRQRAALEAWMRMAAAGQLTEDAFATSTPSPAHVGEQLVAIDVAPVAVSPIAVGGVLPFGTERK